MRASKAKARRPIKRSEVTVIPSAALSKSISSLGLTRKEALALHNSLRRLENIDINSIKENHYIHKAQVEGHEVYSMKATPSLRLMFGVDKDSKQVLLYDVVSAPSYNEMIQHNNTAEQVN